MTRNLITGTVRCDTEGCSNYLENGTAARLQHLGWMSVNSPYSFISNYHFCPEHHNVQNSGQEESTMTTKITAQQSKDFLTVRDAVADILKTNMFVGTERVADMDGVKDSDFDDVAVEIMTAFNMEKATPDQEQPF